MMDEVTLMKILTDRFEGFELVELLDISTGEIVDAFQDKIEENFEFLEDYVTHGR